MSPRKADGVTSSRVITESLGGSALSRAVQTDALPEDLRVWRPRSVDEWRQHVERVRTGASAQWLDAVHPALAASGEAAARLEKVRGGRGIVVTTGQQAGLFGGPVYTLSKALSALGLADTIEKELGVPAATVFWAATDDADFLEACGAQVADASGLHHLRLTNAPPAGTPMSDAPLGDVRPLLRELRNACGSAAWAEFYELTHDAFTKQRTLGGAYVAMLRSLLEPLGVAVFDASHAAARAAARPVLVQALESAPVVARTAGERAAAIRRAGFEPQVEDDRGLSLVFAIERGLKRRLSVDDAPAFARESSNTPMAPNVLLRPVVERALFPTVAYVAGPGELAYFTQANAVAAAIGRAPVVGVPRWSCTIIEPFAERALSRLGVGPADVKDRHALERRLATAAIPEKVAAAWRRLEAETHTLVQALGAAVNEAGLMPPAVIEGLDRALAHRLSRAERRLVAAAKRRDERVRKDVDVACGALFPDGQRQERVLNYVPMLARGGNELLDAMRVESAAHARSLVSATRPEAVAAR